MDLDTDRCAAAGDGVDLGHGVAVVVARSRDHRDRVSRTFPIVLGRGFRAGRCQLPPDPANPPLNEHNAITRPDGFVTVEPVDEAAVGHAELLGFPARRVVTNNTQPTPSRPQVGKQGVTFRRALYAGVSIHGHGGTGACVGPRRRLSTALGSLWPEVACEKASDAAWIPRLTCRTEGRRWRVA